MRRAVYATTTKRIALSPGLSHSRAGVLASASPSYPTRWLFKSTDSRIVNTKFNNTYFNCSRRLYSSQAAMASKDQQPAAAEASSKAATETLPKLSPAEFRAYNRMADKMDLFHNHFRQTWNLLFNACKTNKRPSNMSLRQFLTTGLSFADQLTAHHTIEERYVFPMLATRMPEFDPKNGDLVKQHEQIHEGLEEFQGYLLRCKMGEEDFEMSELKRKMESWGDILWSHLDEEVKGLGAERMRQCWTKEEIQAMPM